ncbi:hypothetical protein T484DRAFT_1777217 [Baffinella frigidus]|nr:hypothetical protein T484DRAFT_1777217 [Cryptophyta sp. CCMP2293]
MAANAVADAARPESVIGHLIPANGILLQFEEMVHQVFFEREKHLAQEKLHSVTKEARAADQAENAALQRHLHQTMEQLKHSKAGHLGCKLQLEEAHVEIDSLKARLRVASRELEDAKAEAIEEKGRSAAEATRATEASDATWDALWATESAKCEAKMKEMDQAHATDIRTVREQAEEKLLTFSVNRCATVSATVSEAMLKQRLSE